MDTRRLHARVFLALAEQAESGLVGPQQGELLKRLDAEQHNLREALEWSLEHAIGAGAESVLGIRLAGALWRYWDIRGRLSEGRVWLERALAVDQGAPMDVRSKALNHLGHLVSDLGDYPAARAYYEESLALRRQVGDQHRIADSLNALGLLVSTQGDYAAARRFYEEALTLWREVGHERGVSVALSNLGEVAAAESDYPRARALQEEALALQQAVGDLRSVANTSRDLAEVTVHLGDTDRARLLFEQSLAIVRNLEDKFGIADALDGLGRVALDQGGTARAAVFHGEALGLRREMGDRRGVAASVGGLAEVAGALGQSERAVRLLAAAAVQRKVMGAPSPPGERVRGERFAATLRGKLGEDAYANAWDAGRAMTEAEAATDARNLAREVPALPSQAPVAVDSLTSREREVLRLIVEGHSDREIGAALGISPRTAMRHVPNIYAKLGVGTRSEAKAIAIRDRLV